MIAKQVKLESDTLKVNLGKLLRNYVTVLLGKGSMGLEQMSRLTGVKEDTLGDYLDKLIDEGTKFKIMENCGYNCAKMNKGAIEEVVAKRKKFKTSDEFIEAEQKNPLKGTRLVREGDVLYQYYTPQSYGVRCYCEMVTAAEGEVSPTYCHCSKGFIKKLWEAVLEKPVDIDFIQSAISGANECKFAIHI